MLFDRRPSLPIVLALSIVLLSPSAALLAQQEDEPGEPSFVTEEEPESQRATLTPWSVEVLGKSFDHFSNEDASKVLQDWLTNALMSVGVFHVVDRDKIQAALSEHQLVTAGYAEDVPASALADAGKLLKVNFILLGNFKNLTRTTEIDFKLLDVDTTTYPLTMNFSIQFNPSIEAMKPEIDRVVAALAAEFPVVADIGEILSSDRIRLAASTGDGVAPDMEAEILDKNTQAVVGHGYVERVDMAGAVVVVEEGAPELSLFDHQVRIKIVPPAQAALSRGLRYYEEGKYAEAARSFEKGLELDPDDGVLQANVARSYWHQGAHDLAVPAFRRAIELRPEDDELLVEAATAYLESGFLQQVIELLSGVEGGERSVDLLLLRGQAHEIQGNPSKARADYRKAFRLDGTHPGPHLRLGVLAVGSGDLEEADRELRLAAEGAGNEREVQVAKAIVDALRAGTDPTAVVAPFAESAVQESDLATLATAGELLLAKREAWATSLDLAQKAQQINKLYLRAHILAARAYAQGGQASKALQLIDQGLEVSPNNLALLFLAADLLKAEGNHLGAESRLRQAKELAPDSWRAPEALGDLLVLQDKQLAAVSEYQTALERAEKAGETDLEGLLYRLGRSLVEANQLSTAVTYLERCVALAPDHTGCYFQLGLCYYGDTDEGNDEKALAAFQAAEDDDRLFYLGTLYDRRFELDEATDAYRRCVEADCSKAEESQVRLDEIESITGSVVQTRGEDGEIVTIDIGRIQGVSHSRVGVIVDRGQVVGRFRVEKVQDQTATGSLTKGKALEGQTVRFRPSRPRGLVARKGDKKGVHLSWKGRFDPEVDHFEVFRSTNPKGPWGRPMDSKRSDRYVDDKKADRGDTYYYRVIAVSETKERSLPSEVLEFDFR